MTDYLKKVNHKAKIKSPDNYLQLKENTHKTKQEKSPICHMEDNYTEKLL